MWIRKYLDRLLGNGLEQWIIMLSYMNLRFQGRALSIS